MSGRLSGRHSSKHTVAAVALCLVGPELQPARAFDFIGPGARFLVCTVTGVRAIQRGFSLLGLVGQLLRHFALCCLLCEVVATLSAFLASPCFTAGCAIRLQSGRLWAVVWSVCQRV